MIALTDEHAGVLKQGYPVRIFVPQLGGDVVVVLADQQCPPRFAPLRVLWWVLAATACPVWARGRLQR